MSSAINPLSNQFLNQGFMVDTAKIRRRLFRLKKQPDSEQKQLELDKLSQLSIKAKEKADYRRDKRPKINYPEALPISQKRLEISKAIEQNQVVIIAGETGSGKTTQLPKICLDLGLGSRGLIGHTQPRRLAARSVATRIAEEVNSPLGEVVGYKVRFSDAIKENSYVKLMTDGILLAELTSDKYLNQYDTIIIDEAHERSLNIDFILGYLKDILQKRRDLKVIITSATIDVDRFSKHFSNAPVIEVSGRTFPVETRYNPLVKDDSKDLDVTEGIFSAVEELMSEGLGDILIFMNGEREIRDTAEQLNKQKYKDTEVLPLYARLSYGEQSKVFKSHIGRRIVLATNVAETSLTVPGIRYVIDPGTARISRYSYRTKVQRLPIEPISQASANQRQGRCGRVGAGICIRLYDEQDFLNRPEFTDPEILRTNLASVILKMLAIGLGDIAGFPFIQPPDERHIKDGFLLLEELTAVSSSKGQLQLTQLGRQLAQIPVDPRLARMIIEANKNDCLQEVMIITAGLSIQDPRERPIEKQQAADESHRKHVDKDSDFVGWLNLWQHVQGLQKDLSASQFRKQCKAEYIAYLRIREWQDLYTQLRQAVHDLKWKLNTEKNEINYDSLHQSILSGLLSHIGFKTENNEYLGARNRKFFVFPGSPLAKKGPKWLMTAELTETSRLFARTCAKIDPDWIEPLAGHLLKSNYNEPHFEAKQGSVIAYENQVLYGLTTIHKRKVQYGKIDPIEARDIFIRNALAEGQLRTNETFFIHNQKQLEQIELLEHKSRRRDILVDEQVLVDFYDPIIPDNIFSATTLFKWWNKEKKQTPQLLHFDSEMLYKRDADHVSSLDFPDQWFQGNLTLPISYQFEPGNLDDGVSIHIPVALLNQIENKGFDWSVAGLRLEKCTALIKSLPKTLRRNFVPAPDYANACVQAMKPFETDLLTAFCKQLLRMSGVKVTNEDFDLSQLTTHLLVNFRVEDHNGKLIEQSRDIESLQAKLQGKVKQAIRQVADSGIEKENIETWNFGDLPKQFQQKRSGFEVKAFPALVDTKDSVAIKLFDNEHQALQQNRVGLRRLLLLNIPSPVKHLQQKLPNKAKLSMYFNPFGQVNVLIEDIINAAVQQLLDEKNLDVRNEVEFVAARDWVRAELNVTAETIALQAEQILTLHQKIKKRIKGKISLDIAFAMSDIQAHIDRLVFKGFVESTGWERLPDLKRYLMAIENRLDKLPVDPTRDRLQMHSINKVEQALEAQLAKVPKLAIIPEDLQEAKWMIEEYRVSCFAQILGTKFPISEKRILIKLGLTK